MTLLDSITATPNPTQTREVQQHLIRLGFPTGATDGQYGPRTRRDVARFQLAYNLGAPLAVDGIAGPATMAALRHSVNNLDGRCSPNFWYREFKSNGNGGIMITRRQVRALETLRAALGRPISTISDYRDPDYNRRIGGATQSMHLYGTGNDLPSSLGLTIERAVGLKVFSGIGWKWANSRKIVTHVDSRGPGQIYVTETGEIRPIPVTTHGTPTNPTIWDYN